MQITRMPAILATAAALAAVAQPVAAQPVSPERQFMNTLTRFSTQYGLIMLRTLVDLTYEHLSVDPRTGDVVLTGLKVYPLVPWDQDGKCEVSFGRITRSDQIGFDVIDSRFEISDMKVSQSCFEPEQGAMLSAFGYEGLTASNLALDITYEFASSAAHLSLQASVEDAATVALTANFDYLWVTLPAFDPSAVSDDPQPVALLSEAEIAIENRGLFERLEPMLQAQLGDLSAAPQMVEAVLMQGLTEGGTKTPGAAEQKFVKNVAAEIGRFITERNRIVLSSAPEGGVWLKEDLFNSPASTIEALQPQVSAAPLNSRALLSTAQLQAAISGQTAGMDPATALKVGRALLTGIGAPRSVAHGQALLTPLAEQWNAAAALLLADALDQEGDTAAAYRMALRAAAGGESGALAAADRIEQKLPVETVLGIQAEAAAAWPGAAKRTADDQALVDAANIAGMRERAQDAALGRDTPRAYGTAYYWASLAAAAGDRGAASLRERLDRRFAGLDGAGRDAWKGVSQQAANAAIGIWTEGGLGARVAAMYGVVK